MQINSKSDDVTIKLTQAEGRRLRDASYITSRIANNLPADVSPLLDDLVQRMKQAAVMLLELADKYTPEKSQRKLNLQDAQQPDVPEKGEAMQAVPEILQEKSE